MKFDFQASIVADRYCEAQLRYGTRGHFTVDAEAPYMRYSFAGGNDGLSENAASWSADYAFPDRIIPELIRRSHVAMLAEIPPDDGHRRTILDPAATHVGIGLAWSGGEFRMTEEFLRRYVVWSRDLPRNAATSDQPWCSGQPVPGYEVRAISVHYEPHPEPITTARANQIDDYSLPAARTDFQARPVDRTTDPIPISSGPRRAVSVHETFPVSYDGSFSFAVSFDRGPGIYTVVVWVRQTGSDQMIAASNISIRVGQGSRNDVDHTSRTTAGAGRMQPK